MRAIASVMALGLMVACTPQIPDSAAGAGFTTAPADAAIPAPDVVAAEPLDPLTASAAPPALPGAPVTPGSTVSANSSVDIAREAAAALSPDANNSGAPASPDNPAPALFSNPGISDENDFQAVSGRQTIKSDAERLARNEAQYEEIAPTALPVRDGPAQPNIVTYALGTSNQPGTRLYSRSGLNTAGRAARNCRSYTSPDRAQMAFLAAGGPERDRHGLDPDGDGFACDWDPTPFRKARGG